MIPFFFYRFSARQHVLGSFFSSSSFRLCTGKRERDLFGTFGIGGGVKKNLAIMRNIFALGRGGFLEIFSVPLLLTRGQGVRAQI